MAAKLIQVSDDAEVSWETLPGSTGSISLDGEQIEDTILGQTFQSNEAGLVGWSIESEAIYKGFAGYQATVKQPGTPTVMTGEAMTLESGQIYRVTEATRDLWERNPAAPWVVYDNAIDETANVEWIDYLFGRVKFLDAYSINTPVTVDGEYLPLAALAGYQGFTLTMTADAIEDTDFPSAQANSGHRTFTPGLRTVSIDLTGVYASANTYKIDLIARSEVVIEINADGNDLSRARGFFKIVDTGQSGDVGALEEETVTYALNVPTDTPAVFRPFGWDHDPTTTLHESVQILLTAWEDEAEIDGQYLHDGINGWKGAIIVTDVSLSSGLDAMNMFNVTLQGSGQTTVVP